MASISVALLGCGKPAPIGTFVGHRNDVGRPDSDPVVVAQLNRIILRIGTDGKASLEDGGLPWEGHVARSGDRLEFEVDAIDGRGISRQPDDLPRRLEFDVLSNRELSYADVRLVRAPSP